MVISADCNFLLVAVNPYKLAMIEVSKLLSFLYICFIACRSFLGGIMLYLVPEFAIIRPNMNLDFHTHHLLLLTMSQKDLPVGETLRKKL